MRRVRSVVAVLALAAMPLALVAPATAASCVRVTIGGGATGLTLTPKTATITAGGCVTYVNATTPLSVQVTVGKVSGTAVPGNAVTFAERVAGTYAVTAAQQPVGASAHGSLVVRAAPRPPAPSPAPSATTPPAPSPSPVGSQSTGPQVAPTPTAPAPTPSHSLVGPGQGNPPIIEGIPTPTPTPSTPTPVVVGQLQPPSTRGVGLPAAVAALLVLGSGTAIGRVLLAEPLDRH